jgi:hypothetical protein|tara:strand:+ start:342 stop:1040 length:699 start_codon:yes stop_codon:yes gene_type:complete
MGLLKNDLGHLVDKIIEIDSYKSKMGEDSDIVTLAFSVHGNEPAKDLENFIEKGYPFVLDADVTSGEQSDGTYKVFVEIERNKDISNNILEIADGVKKLSELETMKFRYYKNFRSRDLDEENLAIIPVDQSSYEIAINETQYENYKNFFTKSYAESIDMLGETLIIKNTYAQPMRFEVTDFGRDPMIEETINMKDMGEVIFLSKVLGDYNITKFGNTIVLTNEGYRLHLKRI